MKVYTRTGDDGTTGLFYGGRVPKDAIGPTAYGTVDETVAALGVARAAAPDDATELATLLLRLQRELFVVGAELATAPENRHKLVAGETLTTAAMVEALEPVIDEVTQRFEAPREFVIPGENPLSAALDLARAVARRAEREACRARDAGWLAESSVIPYLNRLADLLFVLARWQEDGFRPLHEPTSQP